MDMNRRAPKVRDGVAHALACIVVLGCSAAIQAQQTVLEVIDLRYRSADQIVPLLTPLLAPGGTISSLQNRVIVRTTPQNLAELHKVLDAIDTLPRRLMISVRREPAGTGLASETEISGSIGTDGARASARGSRTKQGATVEVRKGDNVARSRMLNSQSAATDRGVQTLQVLEGNEALVRIGQSVPVRSGSAIQTPQGTQISNSVEYRDADTGFRVRPRVNGNRVTLEISLWRDTLAAHNSQTFNGQGIETIVSGRLGEWIEIGGMVQSRTQTEGETISRSTGSTRSDSKVFLKVEQLP